jgi:putative acetyltransferase
MKISEERPDHPDAALLVTELESHLEQFYPPESRHGLSVERLISEAVAFFVLRVDGEPAGCGGIKLVGSEYGELKRMYVRPRFRGRQYGRQILERLSEHALSQGIGLLRLETGIHQKAAIRMYEAAGFYCIPPFPPYKYDPVSVCMERRIALRDTQIGDLETH